MGENATGTGAPTTGANTGAGTPAAGANTGTPPVNTGTGTPANGTGTPLANTQPASNSQPTGFNFDTPEFKKFLQSEIDRATNKLGNENKTLRTQLETLQKSKLTEGELKDAQIAQREADIEQREAALKVEKNRMYAMTAIKGAGLDDGTDTALGLIDLVMADEEAAIDAKVKTLDTLVKKMVSAEVSKTFKEHGRVPGKGADEGKEKKPGLQVAEQLGKKAAESNKQARSVLDYYTGGKK